MKEYKSLYTKPLFAPVYMGSELVEDGGTCPPLGYGIVGHNI